MNEEQERVLEAIRSVIGLSDEYQDGTYLHHLTRTKSAYSYGTITIEDFVEIDDELTYEIFEAIKPFLKSE